MKLSSAGVSRGRLLGPKLYRQISSSRRETKCDTEAAMRESQTDTLRGRRLMDQAVIFYERLLEKHTPTAFEVYRSLSIGIKLLYKEFRIYRSVKKKLEVGQPTHSLSRKELEVYSRIPNDIVHVAPALLIIPIPWTFWIIFPLLYFCPKQLLSQQFWTSRQLRYFEVGRHLSRVQYHDSVLWHLERSNMNHEELKAQSLDLLTTLRSGKQPSIREILNIKPLFQYGGELALQNLRYKHIMALSLSLGIPYGGLTPYRKSRRFGVLLLEMDRKLAEESLAQLTEADLQQCCFLRGFNPVGLTRAEAEQYLDSWLRISLELQDREISLLLHSPIFLAYNHRNNFGNSFL